jgi:hypothetical protein
MVITRTLATRGKLFGVAAAVAAMALIGAPAANAFTNAEQDYINDLVKAGIDGNAQQAVSDGHTICTALSQGTDPNDLSATYYKNANGLSHAQADAAVNLAIKDLCPAG